MPKRYIDRNALLKRLCDDDPSKMEDYYYNAIKDAPVADVVEVVRCKDCKNWRHETDGMIDHYECTVFCDYYGRGCVTGAGDYCSYGERKEV